MMSMSHIQKRIIVGVCIVLLYVISRSAFLTKIPIFTDEAIYIRWGQIALQDPNHRFISLEDGKQPLFIWLMLPALKWIADPLVAGRLISILSGFATLIALVVLSWKLFGERIAWTTGVIYVLSPFFLLYDRLALYDSLTTAVMTWGILLSVLLIETLRLDVALFLGMTIGAGLLTKSSAQFALMLLPAGLLLFDWKKKGGEKRFLKWIGLGLVVIFLSKSIELILRLAPLSHMIGLKDHTFVITAEEFITYPFQRFIGNIGGLWNWMRAYATYPLLALLPFGVLFGLKRSWKRILFLSLWFSTPFFVLASFGKVLYPRYLLFMIAPLLPIMACGFCSLSSLVYRRFRSRVTLPIIASIFFFYPSYFSYLVIVDPLNAPLPHVDRFQLLNDWPSGYGIPEVVSFLKERGKEDSIFVGTEGTFGLTPAALSIYLKNEKNIQIKGYWPIGEGIPELIEIAKTGKPTYLLLKDTQAPDPIWPVREISRYQKGIGNVYSILLKVEPKE